MITLRKIFTMGLALASLPILANPHNALSGGGDLNPDLKVPHDAQQKWLDLRVGLSVHWGPSSLGGKEIGWSRHAHIPKDEYDNFYKKFNPSKFDADEWCRLMKRWGVKYISPTAKHHDGFALWFSKHSDYDMENAARKVDIMAELRDACKRHNIVFGAYYSNLDWYHPDWTPYNYGGPGPLFPKQADSPNLKRYIDYMRNQVEELIKDYEVAFIQFDGEWDSSYTHEIGSQLYRDFREMSPTVLLSSRVDIGRRDQGHSNHLYMDGAKFCGDFLDRERVVNHGNNVTEWFDDAWQAWVTLDKTQWSYNKTPRLMSAEELIDDAIRVLGNNGNYMINLGPQPDGSFDKGQIALMDQLGAWLLEHEDAIYATRGGPYYPFKEGVSTRKGNKAWLFILDKEAKELKLPALDQKIKSATVFKSKKAVTFKEGEGLSHFKLPPYKGKIRVIELSFDAPVQMSKHRELPNIFEQNKAQRLTDGISVQVSSTSEWSPEAAKLQDLVRGEGKLGDEYLFHTKEEREPHITLDLGQNRDVAGLIIYNRAGAFAARAEGLCVWLSSDGKSWKRIWKASALADKWEVPFMSSKMGAQVMGVSARYIKIGLDSATPNYLHLPRVELYVK